MDGDPVLDIYHNYFEKQFLDETEEFYRSEIRKTLEESSLMNYLSKV